MKYVFLLQMVELLLQHGANTNEQKSNGACPLHEAAVTGAEDIAHALLLYGASIMMEDDEGMTSLHRWKSITLIELLSQKFQFEKKVLI